jgi:hypothetical protein
MGTMKGDEMRPIETLLLLANLLAFLGKISSEDYQTKVKPGLVEFRIKVR